MRFPTQQVFAEISVPHGFPENANDDSSSAPRPPAPPLSRPAPPHGQATAGLQGLPGDTPVYLPWAAIHMGTSPGTHPANTGITPGIEAGETVVAGDDRKLHSWFASPARDPDCLKNGHNTRYRSGGTRFGRANSRPCAPSAPPVQTCADGNRLGHFPAVHRPPGVK
jgi:hypothetical protein